MAGIRLEGNTSGNVAEVTTGNELKTALSLTPANIGGVRLFSENDPSTNYLKSPETSGDYRLRTGIDTVVFSDSFNSASSAVNTNLWSYSTTGITAVANGGGSLSFNASATATQGAAIRTWQYFPVIGSTAISLECEMGMLTAPLVANELFLFGFGLPVSQTAAPTDGVWLQLSTAGLVGMLYNNGTATPSNVLKNMGDLTLGSMYKFSIIVSTNEVEFWMNDVLLGHVDIPAGTVLPFLSTSLPVFAQKYTTAGGAGGATNVIRFGMPTVTILDIATNKPWSHQLAGAGANCAASQIMGTATRTPVYPVTTTPTAITAAAALTNTTAAAQFTGLGGVASFLPTLTALTTDGILFSYQVPAGAVNTQGKNLYISSVQIHGAVTTALVGNTGGSVFLYSLAYGGTAVTQATAESATAHTSRIIPIGWETYAATAVLGVLGAPSPIRLPLDVPVVVRPGEYVQILVRNLGAVTTTGAITVACAINGYFE